MGTPIAQSVLMAPRGLSIKPHSLHHHKKWQSSHLDTSLSQSLPVSSWWGIWEHLGRRGLSWEELRSQNCTQVFSPGISKKMHPPMLFGKSRGGAHNTSCPLLLHLGPPLPPYDASPLPSPSPYLPPCLRWQKRHSCPVHW